MSIFDKARNLALTAAIASYAMSELCSLTCEDPSNCAQASAKLNQVAQVLDNIATPAWVLTGATLCYQGAKGVLCNSSEPIPAVRARRENSGIRLYRPEVPFLEKTKRSAKKVLSKLPSLGLIYLGYNLASSRVTAASKMVTKIATKASRLAGF